MKKLGFTLSEVIIALGIIGVIAAITAPLIGGIMPDKDKVQVLKAYKTIKDINNQLLDNPSYYPGKVANDCKGFSCIDLPFADYDTSTRRFYQGDDKYITLFKKHLDIVEGNELDKAEFKTADGINWSIEFSSNDDYSAYITIDLDDKSTSPGCSYSSSCTKPDQFKFYVDKYGIVLGNDPLTYAYLLNPNTNDQKADIKVAKKNLSRDFKSKSTMPPVTRN